MAKYEVTFSCGHTQTVDLVGPTSERERKIAYFEEQGLCSECYKAQAQAKQEAMPLTLTVEALPFEQMFLLSFAGNTMPHKDEIKAAGFFWGELDNGGLFGGLSTTSRKGWYKKVKFEEVNPTIDSVKSLSPILKNKITQADMITYNDVKAKREAEQIAKQEKQEQVARIEKPVVPAKIDGKKFNGKIYGKKEITQYIPIVSKHLSLMMRQRKLRTI